VRQLDRLPYPTTALGGFRTFALRPGKAWLRHDRPRESVCPEPDIRTRFLQRLSY
jgi:hypothetical protein